MLGLVLGCLGALVVFAVYVYNKGVSLKNYLQEAFSTMDVYLKKRWDMIPNLVESVKGYVSHESGVLESLTTLRTQNYATLSGAEKIELNKRIGSLFPQIHAVAENYPELKASAPFMQLMSQLEKLEEDIAHSRKYYNATVRDYNTFIQLFPANLLAQKFGFLPQQMFEIAEEERELKKVSF